MNVLLSRVAGWLLRLTGLQYLPVRVRQGYNAGARWTLYPLSTYWRGRFEPAVGAVLLALGDLTGKSCWDLGAHFGYYTVGLARQVGPTGQVAAFEPFPANFSRLERHVRMNGLGNIRLFPLAASDSDGTRTMLFDPSEGETMVHLPVTGELVRPKMRTLDVTTVRLDQLVQDGRLRPPDLIKMDVEGHGHRALAGAIGTLRQWRPTLLVSFHDREEIEGTRKLLEPLGYRWQALHAPRPGVMEGDCLFQPT